MAINIINGSTWINAHENINENVSRIGVAFNGAGSKINKYNATAADIENAILEAINTGNTIKSCGSRWSMSKVAVSNQTIIDTTNMGLKMDLESNDVSESYNGPKNNLLFVQCGAIIKLISQTLESRGKSLKASGASNGQTIAGAIGTGVHGSAIDFGCIQDSVVGLNIIVNSGKNFYIERESYSVVNTNFAAKINATLIKDDALFNAALVSMGCFGFIHGVMIEAENIYGLQTYTEKIKYEDAQFLMDTLDFQNAAYKIKGKENIRPYHFKLYINPYKIQGAIFAETMYKVPLPVPYKSPHGGTTVSTYNKDTLNAVAAFTNVFNGVSEKVITALESLKFIKEEQGENIFTLADTFYDTTTAGQTFACGVCIPIEKTSTTLELMKQMITNVGGIPAIFALRFVKKSKATLAFTRFEQSCIFEIDGLRTKKNISFVQKIPKLLRDNGIPFTFHWGKDNPMDAALVKEMYGVDYTDFILQRSKLMTSAESAVFSGSYTDGLGLSDFVNTVTPIT